LKSSQSQLKELLDKPEWTEDEKRWLLNFLESPDSSELLDLSQEQFRLSLQQQVTIQPELSKKMLEIIHQKTGIVEKPHKNIINIWFVRIAAASVILILLAGIFYFNKNGRNDNDLVKRRVPSLLKNDLPPGGNKAILTLANGSKIILDSAQNGILSSQGNIKIIKLDNGQLAYDKSGVTNSSEVLYNTIATPKGGRYELTLSDGSKVWLNAASSLHFPTAFSGKERKVELTGEGYFEVAHNKEKPFIVTANNMDVRVLGTHFNINAYSDENSIKTTLLEGSVKVSKGNTSRIMVPGDQASMENLTGEITVKKDADLDEAVAWKNGKFIFQSADIKSIMRQLEKWYDVNVVYDKNVTNEEFIGSISRQVNISQILDMLKKAGSVDFEIKGRTVMVK
jgi:transmembrane sensor